MGTKISKRLITIAQQITGKRLLDIGCDHGKLVEYLFENEIINYAFVSDISKPSVLKAVTLLTENGRNFDYAVADGFSAEMTDKKLDECVISGMGGLEIIKILNNNTTNITSFVLQPQNNVLELKAYLAKNKFNILCDIVVKDKNIYYNVIKVQKNSSKVKISAFDLRFGKENFINKNYDFYLYLQYLKEKYNKICPGLPPLKKREINKEIKFVNKAIKKWEKLNG